MGEKYQALVKHLSEISNLGNVGSLLAWDMRTKMPPAGVKARGAQLATVARIRHEMLTSDETARLIEDAAAEVDGADYDSDEASMVRVAQHDYESATKLPSDFVAELQALASEGQSIWAKARANSDFSAFEPTLARMIDLKLREAELRGYEDHPYDALLNQFEPGMKTSEVKAIFDAHKPALIDLVTAISEQEDSVDDSCLHQPFDIDKQREFGLEMVKQIGFDFERGRQDETVHPFAISFARNDVRITTRFNPNFLNPALFGLMHEAGHGMHAQGYAESIDGTPLGSFGGSMSLGVAESQSRTWENLVGRSRGFWGWAYPQLQATFPDQLGDVDVETFYRAINKVQRSFIRVEADEVTYNLHIMVRLEMEIDILSGHLRVSDLPDAWNSKFNDYLGITPPDDAQGILQDVHWSSGGIGYFPTYALGNLLGVQYYNQAVAINPQIPDEIASGKFDTLLSWQNKHIHQHGRKFNAAEITQRATGGKIDPQPFVSYLQHKYSAIYDV